MLHFESTTGVAKLKRKRDDGTNDEHRYFEKAPKPCFIFGACFRPKKQQMITEHFPLRRSMRQTKSTVEVGTFSLPEYLRTFHL